jgi:hypothetical protein
MKSLRSITETFAPWMLLATAWIMLLAGVCTCDTYDEIYDQVYEEIYDEAFDEGFEAGYSDGFDDGCTFEETDSYYEGVDDGYGEGADDLGQFILGNFTDSISHEELENLIWCFFFET